MRIFWISLFVSLFMLVGNAGAQESVLVGDVPLPVDAAMPSDENIPFNGVWIGKWDNQRNHILIVERHGNGHNADVLYAVGNGRNARGRWFRRQAKIEGDLLVFSDDGFPGHYSLSATGRLRGVFSDNKGFAILQRGNLSKLLASPDHDWFSIGTKEVLKTDLVEDDQNVNLTVVTYRPKGAGPHPLALIHHGSTGSGKHPVAFKQMWTNDWFADLLNAHGWIAAFPQRRGRGGSDGLYDEGFEEDRTLGYSPKAVRSLPGADRALKDANAALEALQKRPDIDRGNVLLGGVSRGGVVAIMQAGQQANTVSGVMNFVGGWVSENWGEAQINPTLFSRIGSFDGEVLSIYGEEDQYYSIEHSKSNLAEFEALGVKSQIQIVKVPGFRNGHWAMVMPNLWERTVSEYLKKIR